MCCCSPFSAVVVDPVAICVCHVALHLVFHYCSDLPTFPLNSQEVAESSLTAHVSQLSLSLCQFCVLLSLVDESSQTSSGRTRSSFSTQLRSS